ncbi:MAG: ADP-ribosylglycohydrolase family protein [Bradymonadales bacterium]|jgi:ADP-ribosyl-[dinitrogen reductase] hydrolase
MKTTRLSRAQGCFLGQLCGDALGSLVEFQSAEAIRRAYPHGVRDMADGGPWNSFAGQITDDSEMAIALARSIVQHKQYEPQAVFEAYQLWRASDPPDCGKTICAALHGKQTPESQANGAMMRVSPLGIFGAKFPLQNVKEWAEQDAALTHIHPICRQANALYTMAIADAIATGCSAADLYQKILDWAQEIDALPSLQACIAQAASAPPADYLTHQGWVLLAFQNALYQMLHSPTLEAAIIDSIMRGGDTDTNAAICGALLGAIHGHAALPTRWTHAVLNCRPSAANPQAQKPRPERYWAIDALELCQALLDAGE